MGAIKSQKPLNDNNTFLSFCIRELALNLKSLMGPWWFDSVSEVSQAANRSLQVAFPTQDKRLDALIYCASEVFDYLEENLKLTKQLMTDLAAASDELAEMLERVISSSLLSLATLLDVFIGVQPEKSAFEDSNHQMTKYLWAGRNAPHPSMADRLAFFVALKECFLWVSNNFGRHLDLNSPLVQCLILDKGMDMRRNVLYHKFPGVVRDYGADAFPFDDQKLNKLRKDERLQWESPLANNLVELLGCRPSDTLVKINAGCGPDVVTFSDLSKKVVGLFLCVQGNFIPMLQNVYEQCLAQQKAFEVVLVYMPFSDCLNPQDFQCYVDNLLQKHKLSVWRFPFDNSVSLKLKRLSRSSYSDEVVIIGANSKIERYDREVMTSCGIDAYPFTREGLVQRELERLGQLTFESLLMYGPQDDHFLYHKKVKFPVSSLKSRNILLWIGSLPFDKDFYDRLSAWYTDIKSKNNFEVVFVRSHASLVQIEDLVLSEIMPWYVCPFNCDHSASVLQELFMEGGVTPTTALVEFDTNGHVRSLEAHYLLDDNGSGSLPIGSSALRRDVIKNFRRSYDFMFDFV